MGDFIAREYRANLLITIRRARNPSN